MDTIDQMTLALDANIIRESVESDWAPGYYSALFSNPDGIRIEVNYVPGKGQLEPVNS